VTGIRSTPWRFPVATLGLLAALGSAPPAAAQIPSYPKDVQPLLQKYCYDCHGQGADRGEVALDAHPSAETRRRDVELWSRVAENLRADLMPPAGKPRPSAAERARLIAWIRGDVQQVDCRAPDPGRVTLRRLNSSEYTFTIRDLFGVDVDPSEFLPPDDSGYGFDNIGDVLTVSPLLMEKYFDAAERVVRVLVAEKPAVPEVRRGRDAFELVEEPGPGRSVSEARLELPRPGTYQLRLEIGVGSPDPFAGKVQVQVFLDGRRLLRRSYSHGNRGYPLRFRRPLAAGEHVWRLEVDAAGAQLAPGSSINVTIDDLVARGPEGTRDYPEPHKRLFFEGPAPADPERRLAYAREVLRRVADRAYRRPVEESTLDRLAEIARSADRGRPGDFERGVSRALTAILTSPRFLFRPEARPALAAGQPAAAGVPLDDWTLAARLSYLLWSTAPDDQLAALARAGTLRAQLASTVARMVADEKADRFVSNFVGQWLRTRDVDNTPVDGPRAKLMTERLRRAMRAETELLFAHIMREDRDLLELLTADYTFANAALAKFYGLTEPVEGPRMRKVSLGPDSVRGGILGQGSFLLVTSNPTRTSPVRRGLFVLENLLGAPPPPPPPNLPTLDEAGKGKGPLSVREQLELHRAKPACAGCHARMDPIGLGLESFDAIGALREREDESDGGGAKPIDARGTLITGERFSGVRELRAILATRREAFYRTVTRKLLTFALGRGLEPADDCAVDAIIGRLQSGSGRFSTLLQGVIESRPFQLQTTREEGP
jgi:hypothetical protein